MRGLKRIAIATALLLLSFIVLAGAMLACFLTLAVWPAVVAVVAIVGLGASFGYIVYQKWDWL